MADKQISAMQCTPGWTRATMDQAVTHACQGGLAFATVYETPHGHLAALQPDPMQQSATWGEPVCLIYNVGHENKACKLSGGFLLRQKPLIVFYLWMGKQGGLT